MQQYDYREQFKASAQQYEAVTQSRYISLIYELEKAVMAEILSEINASEKTLMDFACGTGRWTQFLEKHFKSVTGVDVSRDMLDTARRKCSKTEFICTDITSNRPDEKLSGRKFDVITAFRFYKNAQQDLRKAATDSLAEYLEEGGFFIFDLHLNTFSIMGLLAGLIRLLGLRKIFRLGDLAVRTISLGEVRRLFSDSRFEVIDYYGIGLLPGRSNFTLLPGKLLYKIERFFTQKKLFRSISYTLLVITRKRDRM